jgi:adenylate cyclase
MLAVKAFASAGNGLSANPRAELARADQLVSHALAVDPNNPSAHTIKAITLNYLGRPREAIVESERALVLDPAQVEAVANLGWAYLILGQYEKSLEYYDKAIRLSPHDPGLDGWYSGKSGSYFTLKQYDRAIEWSRRSIAIRPENNPFSHARLIAALALNGNEAEARDALQRYLALPPSGPRTIAAWKALNSQYAADPNDPGFQEFSDRWSDGLRKAGMLEK